MAKGDYSLFDNVPFQSVTSLGRRYGVMFNPSSSNSRLRIIDGGQRYACRLRPADGAVEYSTDDGATWQLITPFADPCTGTKQPAMVTHERLRVGEELTGIQFDMIAVGRGRIIAKEKGTDRLFHVYIDELFRTSFALCNLGEGPAGPNPNPPVPEEGGDAPVPPFNMKLDPEYFTTGVPTLIVPPEGTREYANHPGSLRLPVFNQLLELKVADVMLVLERARTWYLKDTRSQLAITSFDDLKFSEADLVAVFTPAVINSILQSIKDAAVEATEDPFTKFLIWIFGDPNTGNNWAARLVAEGFGATIFPLYLAFGAILFVLGESKAFSSLPGGEIHIDMPKLMDYLSGSTTNPNVQKHIDDALAKLGDAVGQLMLRSRRAVLQSYGDRRDVRRKELPDAWTLENRMPTPNQPPSWMPVYVRTSYKQRRGAWRTLWKRFFSENDQIHQVWLAQNANGSLEAFAVDNTKAAKRATQNGPNGLWNAGWMSFNTPNDKFEMLAIVRNNDGRLEAFGVTEDKRVVHIQQTAPNGSWQPAWASFPFQATGRNWIAVEANVDGRLEIFGVGTDNHVWRLTQTSPGVWPTAWTETFPNGPQLTKMWLARNGSGTLEAFGIDTNQFLWRTAQDGPGQDWSGPWIRFYNSNDNLRSLVVGRNADGTLEAIGVNNVGTCWHTAQSSPGNWTPGWAPFPAPPADQMRELRILTNIDGRLEVFGFSDKHIWHTWQTAPNAAFNGRWEEIQANDDDRHSLAVATNEDGSIEMLRVSQEFLTERAWNLRLPLERRFAIQFSKVLDIGIGSSHWSENWQTHFGGEIHSLLAPRPLFQGERYSLIQYRFLNGPVIDGDAFNDGTTNFYMLVKLGPAGADGAGLLQKYAILWFDEQTYFTQRWRLLHPTDDVLGDLFSLPHAMRDNPEWFNFQLANYWCPFRADLIDDTSRMVLRRNVIVVTSRDLAPQRREIYTIVFNYGLCDHSWRWRFFPQAQELSIDPDIAQDQDPQLPADVSGGSANAYVVVNTIDLRDDTTLHVRGSLRSPVTQKLRSGRWFQRYLPADCRHVPERYELTGQKPARGFTHPWDFISEEAYQRADHFYQFGVYEDPVDSRAQYYQIELLPNANGVTPTVEETVSRVWRNDVAGAGESRMKMNTTNFVWALPKQNGVIIKRTKPDPVTNDLLSPELLFHDFRNKPSISMYEPTARFRILERKPLGLIAVFFDKRDDELQSASDLPHPTTFVEDTSVTPQLPRPIPPSIRVLVKSNHRVYQPPNVRKAQIVIDPAPGLRRLHVSFWTPQTEQQVCENIWKVSLAAINASRVVFPIFSVLRFPNFVRRAVPDAPVPSSFTGDLGNEWRYDFDFDFAKEVETDVRRFCTTEGHIEFGTSLWFEDIVGHRALAQELIFA